MSMCSRGRLLSTMMRLGVGFCWKCATAASIPPMCTLTCVLASRRSSAAICTISAMAAFSQKAWMEMRGIGRARVPTGPCANPDSWPGSATSMPPVSSAPGTE
jgi:hypothetical protein